MFQGTRFHTDKSAVIKDVGDLPYQIVRGILMKIDKPEQLVGPQALNCSFILVLIIAQREIEIASPQICGHDEEIWMRFIRRDVSNWANKDLNPGDPPNWYKVYDDLRVESERMIEFDKATLKAALQGIKDKSLNHKSKQVEASTVPPLPKMGGMKYVRSERKKKIVLVDNRPKNDLMAGSRTKVITGRGVIDKARREAKVMGLVRNTSILAVPTHQLNESASQILQAPRSLVYEHQRRLGPEPIDPTKKQPLVFAPKRKRVEPTESEILAELGPEEKRRKLTNSSNSSRSTAPRVAGPSTMSLEERERRLKALKNSRKGISSPLAGPSPMEEREGRLKTLTNPDKRAVASTLTAPKLSGSAIFLSSTRPKAVIKPTLDTSTIPSSTHPQTPVIPAPAKSTPVALPATTARKALVSQPPNFKLQGARPPMKKKAPVNPFMPAKRRRLS